MYSVLIFAHLAVHLSAMIVVLNGNIASGKSAVASALAEHLQWPVLALDDFRRQHNASNTMDGEMESLRLLQIAIRNHANAIVEITSANANWPRMLEAHPGPAVLVHIHCPADECCARHHRRMERGYRLPPFPYRKRGAIDDSIYELDTIIGLMDHDLYYDSTLDSADTIAAQLASDLHTFKMMYE